MANKKIDRDYSERFLNEIDPTLCVKTVVEMGLINQKSMRDYIIVKEVWKLLEVDRMKFKTVLHEVADSVGCSPEHVYRVYSNNRGFLK